MKCPRCGEPAFLVGLPAGVYPAAYRCYSHGGEYNFSARGPEADREVAASRALSQSNAAALSAEPRVVTALDTFMGFPMEALCAGHTALAQESAPGNSKGNADVSPPPILPRPDPKTEIENERFAMDREYDDEGACAEPEGLPTGGHSGCAGGCDE